MKGQYLFFFFYLKLYFCDCLSLRILYDLLKESSEILLEVYALADFMK